MYESAGKDSALATVSCTENIATWDSSHSQVSAKEQGVTELIVRWIDSSRGWRYSQAQIPDLVANAIPRFLPRAQSFGSALPDARWPAEKIADNRFCGEHTAGAKAQADLAAFSARLKSCPDTLRSFPAVYASTPVLAALSRSRFTSTRQRSTGGSRFL